MVSPIRFSGIASGMDTETMVKELMNAQKASLNKLLKKKQLDTWKRDTYREMNTLLLNFRNLTSDMRLQSTYLKKTVTSENDLLVSAKTSATPNQTSYSVKVNKLAVAGTPASAKFTNNIADATTSLNGGNFEITVNGEKVQVTSEDTINSVVSKINDLSSKTGVTVAYMSGDKSLVFSSKTIGSTGKVEVTATSGNPLGIGSHSTTLSSGSITTPINSLGKTIEFESLGSITLDKNYDGTSTGQTLGDLASDIQAKIDADAELKDAGITVSVAGGKLTFTSSKQVNISGGTLLSDINLSAGSFGASGTDVQKGEVVINGVTMATTSNTFTYDGVEYTAKQVTTSAVTINVKPDEDAIFDKVSKFVEEYNKLIDTLNKKISETKYRDYEPLLDEEREALSEKQIEQWEEKAKSGILQRDPHISKILFDMRTSIYTPLAGASDTKYDTLSEIGITAGKPGESMYTYQENGKLKIDEDKLREAIRDNGEKVMELFTKAPTSTTDPGKYQESGVGRRLYEQLNNAIDQITDIAGSSGMSDTSEYYSMGKSMKYLNDEIERWEDRLEQIEARYWKQFTAMEKAISNANSQSTWLTQQFSSGA